MLEPMKNIAEQKLAGEALSETQSASHLLVEQLPVGVFCKNAEGRYVVINPHLSRIHGWDADQMLGKTPLEIAASQPAASVPSRRQKDVKYLNLGADHHEQIMRTGQTIELEEYYPTADGSGQFLHVIKSPVFDARGKVVGSQGVVVDITQRKRAEARLDQEHNLLRALLNKSDDCIYFKDRESRFILCSVNFIQRFNVKSAEDMLGRSDADFFAPEHAREAFADEQKIILTGEPVLGKMEKESWPDQHVTWALTSKWPLWNEAGETIGTFGISKDITAMKVKEDELQQMHKQLVDASLRAGMAEVATSVLHNVGNVLNSINVSSSLIGDAMKSSKVGNMAKAVAMMRTHENDLGNFLTQDPKGKQLLDYLTGLTSLLVREQEDNLREFNSLANNIIHIKEIVAMQQNYAKALGVTESLQIADLVEDAIRMNSGAIDRHKVKIAREYTPVPPILTEKHKVLQILVNLIRNAKYACDDSGKTDKQITFRITGDASRVKISVVDNGIGIPEENLTRIFNHGFTTRKEGHGFGLHSGANTAKELGGALSVFSEGVGHGAIFTLELPFQKGKSL
jgi:PAS domain S-box-containing protein